VNPSTAKVYVGVDVSKERLDVAIRPTGACWSVPNDQVGIDALVGRLLEEEEEEEVAPALVVLEATGGFERPVAATLACAGLAVAVLNPRQARDFARATGRGSPRPTGSTPRSSPASARRYVQSRDRSPSKKPGNSPLSWPEGTR
jgi:hypothetical protein